MLEQLHNHQVERNWIRIFCDLSIGKPSDARLLADQHRIAPTHMVHAAHVAVYEAALALVVAGAPADAVSLWGRLKGHAAVEVAGGFDWLCGVLAEKSDAYPAAAPTYAKTLHDLRYRRSLLAVANEARGAALSQEADADAAVARTVQSLASLTHGAGATRNLCEYLDEVLAEIERKGTQETVIPTGIAALDALIGGLQRTLTVVGSYPGIGKSALLATIARNLIRRGVKVGFFSLEDEGHWIVWRLLADGSGVPQFVMRNRALSVAQQERIERAAIALARAGDKLLIEQGPALTGENAAQIARDWVINRGVQVIILDHLGELCVESKRKDRYDLEVAENLAALRDVAKTMRVPVVVACHLRRKQGEKFDPNKPPSLTDFAESASIERKARVALGLSRPPDGDRLTITVMKQTSGIAGRSCELAFHGMAAMVKDIEGEIRDVYQAQEEER